MATSATYGLNDFPVPPPFYPADHGSSSRVDQRAHSQHTLSKNALQPLHRCWWNGSADRG
jgi:hypothetical protein